MNEKIDTKALVDRKVGLDRRNGVAVGGEVEQSLRVAPAHARLLCVVSHEETRLNNIR